MNLTELLDTADEVLIDDARDLLDHLDVGGVVWCQ